MLRTGSPRARRCSSRSGSGSCASSRRQVARRPSGEVAVYPLVESMQRDGVCAEVIAPAPHGGRIAQAAARIATSIAEELGVTGMLAVELFETDDERILVNELAMRPHNSGHWSIEGAVTDQFEQHLRGVLDLPLGPTDIRAPWTVMVNVLGGPADGDPRSGQEDRAHGPAGGRGAPVREGTASRPEDRTRHGLRRRSR